MLLKPHVTKFYLTLPPQFFISASRFSSLIPTQKLLNTQLPLTKQTFSSLLQSCSANPNQLKQLLALILTTGFSVKNSLITELLTNLIVLGDMSYARKLFDEMHKPRTYLWNTLIKGYVKNKLPLEAALLYRIMHRLGIRPDAFTYPFVVKACSELHELWSGLTVHAHVVKHGLEFVSVLRTELMIMYVRFGEMRSADFLFESMEERDLVSWNALITANMQMGYAGKALGLFRQMRVAGVKPDAVTLVGALSSCGQLGCLEIGEEIYVLSRNEGIDCNVIVDNARLDMYVKCGNIEIARTLFEEMPYRNVISWSAMIVGYAMNGDSENALALFSRMQNQGLRPNYVTFLGVLSACSHAGLVNEGRAYFNHMARSGDMRIQPRKEHYACMVDLLGRSGHLEEAYNFIKNMPMEPDAGVWGALLGACAIHHNVQLGQQVADLLFEVAPDIASYHVLLSNMYAAAGRWDCVDKVRLKMRKKGVKKVAAYSSVEFNGEVHFFHGGDRLHPQSPAIYEKLDDLINQMKCMGYVPKTSSVFHDVETEEGKPHSRLTVKSLPLCLVLSM